MDATGEYDDKYRAISESRIREALDNGEFKNLRGAGKPLDIEESPYATDDNRMAFHILKQNGFKPEWIVLADEIDENIANWRLGADRHFAELRTRLHNLAGDTRAVNRMREEIAAMKARHTHATARFTRELDEINRKIHYFNATVPIQSLQRPVFTREENCAALPTGYRPI